MNYRKTTIHPEETMSAASGTLTIPIRGIDVISRILVKAKVTKLPHANAAPPGSDVTKLEVVDGSDLIFSMTGLEVQALNIYDRKCGAMCHAQHMGACPQTTFYGIDFGRFLFDPQLAFDPTKFSAPQLKISYNRAVSDTSATAITLEAFSDVFDERVITPIGFLMSKEQYSYTCGSNGSFEYIDLPTDHVLRKLLVRAYIDAYEPNYVIESVRLDEENLKRIPIDINLKKYIQMMRSEWTPIEELYSTIISVATGNVHYLTATDEFPSMAGMFSGSNPQYLDHGWIRGGKFTLNCITGSNMHGVSHGYLPNHCVEFAFGDPQNIDDWYDITKLDSLRLRLESGDADTSGVAAVVLQQLRRY